MCTTSGCLCFWGAGLPAGSELSLEGCAGLCTGSALVEAAGDNISK